MQETAIPAVMRSTVCPRCAASVAFPLFEASFYEFATYLGATTGRYYRLDLDYCHYHRVTPERLLDTVRTIEPDGLLQLPLELLCGRCGLRFTGPDVKALPSTESTIGAVLIPDATAAV